MTNEKEIKQRIESSAQEMFYKFGYSKVTMEEIATNLGISKKTLYKYYSNKEHILREIINNTKCEIEKYVNKLIEDTETEFVVKLQQFLSFIVMHFGKLTQPLIQDLAKNQPEIWKDIKIFRQKNAYDSFSKLLEQGIKSGIFREDVNSQVAVIIYFASVFEMINLQTLAQLPITANEAYKQIVKIFFQGIFSEKGREKYATSKILHDINGEFIL